MIKEDRYVLCYTREPQEDMIYSNKLAYSMHLAYSENGVKFEPLNHNYGVLFAKATHNPDGTMTAKSLKCPFLFYLNDDTFGVVAIRTEANGDYDPECKGKVLLFTSKDLLEYTEVGLIDLNTDAYIRDVTCKYDKVKERYIICWRDDFGNWYQSEIDDLYSLKCQSEPVSIGAVGFSRISTGIEGIVPRNTIKVSEEIGSKLKSRLMTPRNIKIEVPDTINVSSPDELNRMRFKAIYSDGSNSVKSIDWNTDKVDWSKPGSYDIKGVVHQEHYEFPFIVDRADPNIFKWNGKYYFISTNDADGFNSLYIREADTIHGLKDAEDHLILDTKTHEGIGGLLWAPELHNIGEDLYIFHAATPGEFYQEECHVMKLRRGGNPLCKEDWSVPRKVVKKDGSDLCEAGKEISLDMTCFEWNKEYYVVWSQRQFLPVDQGAWLYIAKIDPQEPWRLITDPVVISKPDYGWANNHTFVDEGPYALITDKKIFITFSSAAIDATYVVGMLEANAGADLLAPKSWKKLNYPILTSKSVAGQYGPGHNSYVTDDDGNVWCVYHARAGVNGPRSTGIRRVHFDVNGYPVLDLTEDRDLSARMKNVSCRLVVR